MRKTENPFDYDILYDINIEILKEIILEINHTEANQVLDKLIKYEVSPADKTFLLDKLNLNDNMNWTIEQRFAYFEEISKIRYNPSLPNI